MNKLTSIAVKMKAKFDRFVADVEVEKIRSAVSCDSASIGSKIQLFIILVGR